MRFSCQKALMPVNSRPMVNWRMANLDGLVSCQRPFEHHS